MSDFSPKVIKKVNIMPTPKNFTVYRASAGSGKTFTLVREYLALALAGSDMEIDDNFRHILAITFTNKATNQMKERILDTLSNLQDAAIRDGKERNMCEALCKGLDIQPAELSRRAALLQKAILHNYSDFAVCTIDSFMNRVVRTFAIDLGLPPRFDISLDDGVVLENAVDSLIADISDEHPELTKVIKSFALKKMEEGKAFSVRDDILASSQTVMNEDFEEKYELLKDVNLADFFDIAEKLKKDNKEFEETAKQKALGLCGRIAALGLSDDDFKGKSRGGAYAFLRKIAEGGCGYSPSPTLQNNLDSGDIANKGAKDMAAVNAFIPDIQQFLQFLDREVVLYSTRGLLLEKIFQVALLKEVRDKIRDYYNENGLVHISENNKLISETVRNEEAPFVFERLGCRYRHFLIDEFQDTSIMQWQNMLPLIENGLAEGRKSLIVGDGKQAIYRFRQGDVEQFQYVLKVPEGNDNTITRQRQAVVARNGQEENLGTNYRSFSEIVTFNNSFFSFVEKQREEGANGSRLMHDIYVGDDDGHPSLAQEVAKDKEGGCVEVQFYDKNDEVQPSPFERIYSAIERLKSVGYDYKDIAILTRKNDTLSDICTNLMLINNERQKEGRGLENLLFSTAESLKLWNNEDVKFLRCLLGYLDNDNDDVAKLGMSEYLNGRGESRPLSSLLDNKDGFGTVLTEVYPTFDRDWLLSQTLYDCSYELVRIFGVPLTPYVYSFLNFVAGYGAHSRNNLSEFLESLDEVWTSLSTKTSDDLNAVQMMTIHKSKGLEFPVVIYYMLPSRDTGKNEMWVKIDEEEVGVNPLKISLVGRKKATGDTIFGEQYVEEMQKCEIDDLNVLYVALTRPEQQLIVFAADQSSIKFPQYEGVFMDYVKDASHGFVEVEADRLYRKGNPDFCKKKEKKPANVYELKTNESQSWARGMRIVGKTKSKLDYHQSDAQQVGNIVHEILSRIGTLDEVEDVKNDFFAEAKLDKEVEQRVSDLLHSVLETKAVRPFFDSQYDYKTECDIMHQGEIVRPDRIVFANGETWVVDYKTGDSKAEHKDQVHGYMSVLKELGYANVKGFLLYISSEGCEVERV